MKNLSRREFLALTAGGAAAAVIPLAGCQSEFTGQSRRADMPNIIFILADDLGYGDLGCYGQKRLKTPNLDQMAAEGMRFTQCYAGATVCCPSRSSLLTGKHTGHCRHRANKSYLGGKETRIPFGPEDITFGDVLKSAGYTTAIIGKWHLGGKSDLKNIPPYLGFDYSLYSATAEPTKGKHYPEWLWKNGPKFPIKANQNGKKGEYMDGIFTNDAMNFISQNKNKPFFLYLSYQMVHSPMDPPTDEPYSNEDWPELERRFAAMTTRLDYNVSKVLAHLKKLGLDKNTIVFFTSDNGPHHEGGHDHTFFDSNGPLRGYKRDLYEGGIRVPMIVRWPGKVPAGKVSEALWYFADVLPTLAELAEAQAPPDTDGISVLAALLGQKQNTDDRFLYWEFHSRRRFKQAARWRNFKAVRLALDKPLELYNLFEDIAEENNIANRHPEIIVKFEDYLAAARTDSPFWPIKKDK